MKLLTSRSWYVSSSKSLAITCVVINKKSSHLRRKTANKCLGVCEQAKMVERNKDDPLPSPAFMWIPNVSIAKPREKVKLLWKFYIILHLLLNLWSCTVVRIETNPSSTRNIEVMIVPHKNRKNSWKFKSDHLRMKKRYD